MKPDSADDVADVSAALVKVIGQAHALGVNGRLDDEFADLLIRARQLYVNLLEMLLVAEPDVPESIRGLATSLGNNLDRLEAALRGSGLRYS